MNLAQKKKQPWINHKLDKLPQKMLKTLPLKFPMSAVTIFCVEALLFLVPFAQCFSHEEKGIGNTRSSTNKQQGFHDIVVHGILLWASMGLLMPVGILTLRISTTMDSCHLSSHKILFYFHSILQAMSVILATVGAVLSIRTFENTFNNTHQRIGLALYGAIYLQVLFGFKRPKRGTKYRTAWYFLHWILGTSTCLVAILNVYTGLQAFHERTSRSTTLWTVIFTVQLCFMTILYLFQEKWEYIQKQGVKDDGETSDQADRQSKDVLMDETARKSNALGSHFSRTNVLNRLLQQP